MKNLAYSIFAAILVMTTSLKASAQTTENRQVSGYSTIALWGPFDVHIKIDGTESLKITGDPDIVKNIESTVTDGKLEVKFKHHFEWHNDKNEKIEMYITAKSLNSLFNSGSGAVKLDGVLTGQSSVVTLSGSGEVDAAVKADEVHVNLSGSGVIHLNGGSHLAKIIISGSGQFIAKEFKTGDASVLITGSGSAYLNADKTLSAKLIGSGNVVYNGNATVSTTTIGSGRVTKEN